MTFCCDIFGMLSSIIFFFTPSLVCILISTPVRTETIIHALSLLCFFGWGVLLWMHTHGSTEYAIMPGKPPRPPVLLLFFFLSFFFFKNIRWTSPKLLFCANVVTFTFPPCSIWTTLFSLVNIRCFVNLSARFHCDYAQFAWIPETAMGRYAQSCTRLHGQRHWDRQLNPFLK